MTDFRRDLERRLRDANCRRIRSGKGSHEVWFSPVSQRNFSIPAKVEVTAHRQCNPEAGGSAQGLLNGRPVGLSEAPTQVRPDIRKTIGLCTVARPVAGGVVWRVARALVVRPMGDPLRTIVPCLPMTGARSAPAAAEQSP